MKQPSSKLDILFVSSDKYPPFRPAARVIFEQELARKGHRIDWIIQSQNICDKPYKIPIGQGFIYVGVTDNGASRICRLRKHILSLINDFKMVNLAIKNRYNLIQIKDKYISAILAIIITKALNIKFFYWIAYPHAEASIYNYREGIARYPIIYLIRGHILKFLLYRIILPTADHIFVQSEQMKQDFIREGIPEQKMTPIPGSVNLENIPYQATQSYPPNKNDSEEIIRLVYLGTLNRVRRLDFILKAFRKVLTSIPNTKLYILGKGDMPEDEAFLKKEVIRLGIDNAVIFTGHLPMKQAWEFIKSAAVCLSPYYPTPILLSTSPTKLVEYMAMGKPVVGNDHPEQKLVIKKSGAGICVPWDESAFAQAIVRILQNPKIANEMGIKGRRYVEKNRTNDKMANIVEKTYRKFCGISFNTTSSPYDQEN